MSLCLYVFELGCFAEENISDNILPVGGDGSRAEQDKETWKNWAWCVISNEDKQKWIADLGFSSISKHSLFSNSSCAEEVESQISNKISILTCSGYLHLCSYMFWNEKSSVEAFFFLCFEMLWKSSLIL